MTKEKMTNEINDFLDFLDLYFKSETEADVIPYDELKRLKQIIPLHADAIRRRMKELRKNINR